MARRPYDGTRREAQARQTREAILDAMIAALARQEAPAVSALAEAAGVSVPTVYRYFPTREALMDATQEAIGARLGRPEWPSSAEVLIARVSERYAWFEDNGVLIRAILSSAAGREILASVQRRREHAITRALSSRTTHLPPGRARAARAIIAMLDDAHTWRQLRDAWQISPADAAWAAHWATRILMDRLEAERTAAARRPRTRSTERSSR